MDIGISKFWLIGSLIFYFTVLLFISFYKNKNETQEDYFLGGRRTPYWILATAFVATWYGGNSALISVDKAFEQGLSSWWVLGGPTIIAAIIILVFASAIRRVGSMSQTEMMVNRYNRAAGIIMTIILVLYFISWMASQMIAIGKFMSSTLEINYTITVIAVVIICLVYAGVGGFRAVVLTEMLQFFLLVFGLCITMIVALYHSGGISAISNSIQAKAADGGYFNLFGSFTNNLVFIISFSIAFTVDGAVWQRVSASKNPREAHKTVLQALLYFIPLYFFVVITGMAATGIYTEVPVGGIVPALIKSFLGPVMASFVFLGIAAAIMSTITTLLNVSSLYITEAYHRYIKPTASERELVYLGMSATLFAALVGIFVALRLPDALIVLTLASQILAAGVFAPLMFGFVWKRGNTMGAISSLLFGSGFILYNYAIELGAPFPVFWNTEGATVIIIGFFVGLTAYITGSLLTKPDYNKSSVYIKAAGFVKS